MTEAKHGLRRWRVGRTVGRTIYEQQGDEPSDSDPLIGVMDTWGLAADAVGAHNYVVRIREARGHLPPPDPKPC